MSDDLQPDNWYSDEAATFGDRLATAREEAGLTARQLADRIGVRKSVLEDWESDAKEPRANRLQMLSGMLNVSLSWLMTGKGDGPSGLEADEPLSQDVTQILTEMRTLRTEIGRASDRLGLLEKQLRRALQSA